MKKYQETSKKKNGKNQNNKPTITMTNKRLLGQFFTIENPLKYDGFMKWWKEADKATKGHAILEPFAGANNIIQLAEKSNISRSWECYDIEPPEANNCPQFPVVKRDTLQNFPKRMITITNPPYLAKNSATRRGLPFPETKLEDLYQVSLTTMLDNCEWVAAIIPASFLTQDILQERAMHVVQLSCRMFDDTDCPVCLATFGPENTEDFYVYNKNEPLGLFNKIKNQLPSPDKDPIPWTFNDPKGEIGLRAIDNNKERSIQFVPGNQVKIEILPTSRSITRIKSPYTLKEREVEAIIEKSNKLLKEYRDKTSDILLTPFKGLRKDGEFRRRLDFKQARCFLNAATQH